MQAWALKLRKSFESLNEHVAGNIEALRVMLRSDLPMTKCGKCAVDTLDGDLARFDCRHVLCFDCLGDLVERQRGYLERHPRRDLRSAYPILTNIVLCFECHRPHVIIERFVFETGFNQNQLRSRGRREYTVNTDLTERLAQSGFRVHTCFENQRRGVFSKFSAADNAVLDRCGPTSNEDGTRLDLAQLNRQLAEDQVWLEDWAFDTRTGDPQGWSYALNWPSGKIFSWALSASFTTFVRRRRLMRTMLRLTKDLQGRQAGRAGDEESDPEAEEGKTAGGGGGGGVVAREALITGTCEPPSTSSI